MGATSSHGPMPDSGRAGEDLIAEVSAQSLFFDFVHERPFYQRGNIQKEVCDLLIAVDRDALILQIKAQSIVRRPRDEERWFLKQLPRARRQLSGAWRTIAQRPIIARNRFRDLVSWVPGDLTVHHALGIFDVTGPCSVPFDPAHTENRERRAQCFTFTDFLNVASYLGSFPDLVDYLNERSTLPWWTLPDLGAERDLFAYYLMYDRHFPSTIGPDDIRGQWSVLTQEHRRAFDEKLRADQYTEVINDIIRDVHNLDEQLGRQVLAGREVPASVEAQRQTYLKAAALLNRLPSLLRRQLGKEILDKAISARERKAPRYLATRHPSRDAALVFHVSALDRAEGHERTQVVLAATMAHYAVTTGLGIAIQDLSDKGHGYTYVWNEGLDFFRDPELVKMSSQILGDERLLRIWDFPQ